MTTPPPHLPTDDAAAQAAFDELRAAEAERAFNGDVRPLFLDEAPSDAEQLALVRQRLATVEAAIEAYLDVAEQTGTERQVWWEAVERALAIESVTAYRKAAATFISAYQRTLEPRRQAMEALQAALTTDFQTAVVCSADMTEEQRREWLSVPPRPDVPPTYVDCADCWDSGRRISDGQPCQTCDRATRNPALERESR